MRAASVRGQRTEIRERCWRDESPRREDFGVEEAEEKFIRIKELG